MSGVQLYQSSSSAIFLNNNGSQVGTIAAAFTGGYAIPLFAQVFQASSAIFGNEQFVVDDTGYYSQLNFANPELASPALLLCDTTSAVASGRPLIKIYSGLSLLMSLNCNGIGFVSASLCQVLPFPFAWIKDLRISITQQAAAADAGSFNRIYMIKSRVLY